MPTLYVMLERTKERLRRKPRGGRHEAEVKVYDADELTPAAG
ncbi:hypothetical protein [Streptosporangium sp. NPDC000396]